MLFHFPINIHEKSIKHDSIVGFIWQTLPNYHVPYNYTTNMKNSQDYENSSFCNKEILHDFYYGISLLYNKIFKFQKSKVTSWN